MAEPRFIHLRVHSDFSMVDGLQKINPIVGAAAANNMPALALTDQMNMCGLVRFYGAAHGKGIKPIVGADFWVQSSELGDEQFRLTLLAMDNDGYQNITLLISRGYQRGHVQGRPVIDKEWLTDHAKGVIVLSGGREGDVGKFLLKGNRQMTESCLAFYQTHFPDAYYLELLRTGRPDEEVYLHMAVAIATEFELPVVATNEVVFLNAEDFDAHEIRVAIHDGYTLMDKRRPRRYSPQQYLRSQEEMAELFADIPEALENTVEIAKRCNVTVRLGEYFLPNFPTGDMTTEDFLVAKSKEGLEERLAFLFPDPAVRAVKRGEYDERLEIELKVINQMGFPGYFLIVMEFIQWSKDNGIPVGPGRGSGAGSLVAYALKITDLDPLEFDLLFERFLNPERVSMPDFDVDFCMDRRDEVIEHVSDMYGRDAVSQIITFGSMAAKAVVRDVGRVLGHAYGFVDRISKLIPPDPGMTLAKAFEAELKLPELYEQDEEVKDLIDMARRLEGVVRNAGKHAGGVVIAPTKITDFAPLYCDDSGNHPVTQFDKNDVEYAGLVKFDFLGLRTLTIIDWALGMINPRLAKEGKPPVDIAAIPIHDKKSFDLLQRFETTAVFQLESRGMKDLIKRLQPDCFEDMIALVALFRPGPLQSGMVDNFIERKHGKEAISYPDEKWQHESLKPILEPTYGIILYQEQVMQIAQVLAGYTLGGADMLRRAMGKKNPAEMAKQRSGFEEGAVKNGIDGELAVKIFDLVEKFAGYGFNKSHSAAYALVSYQTLWLKTHFPAEFMAAVMTADMDNTDKIVTLVDECQRMGLTVIPPDVNTGRYRFSVNEDGHIVYGIGAVKGVGEGPIDAILSARDQDGPFRDLFDFCNRVDIKKINKRVMEKLILSGAMDRLGPHRAALMATLEEAMRAAEQHAKAQAVGQVDMFGVLTQEIDDVKKAFANVPHWPDKVWLEGERETLGLYLTGHPINQYSGELRRYTSGRLCDLHPTSRDTVTTAAGLVIAARSMVTKRGNKMGIFTLDDRSGRLDVTLFSEALEKYEELMQKDRILVVSGQVSFDDFSGGLKMSARELLDINDARERFARAIRISLDEQRIDDRFFPRLCEILEPARAGVCPVQVNYRRPGSRVRLTLGTEWRVTPTDQLIDDLRVLLGRERVELVFD
ncbi:TPA: DNA polymerase III subunit alpha [Aeromonas salmonicida]|nr:DNA polymerase III subunit alpha [Aeromonas salmonicida]AYO65425.1 DNA polymerase III subunit alpha [Aeromonas salmonicida subsp. salmonicida 01-B526]EHI53373.1 DNA polymerase III, alpha subunit [Aeromonas salmonicida subsp. salmonicida 01-B526]EKP0237822.1 DNA polymerase III subunit alpha [Aeromonas salmonicida]EKP0242002.1 DNA polymerase III subunit alpha [Aeromonas salmonicida]EKP0250489.1 DNA polymerase III subunit alpha [Aeromonas salmonicida]